MVEILQSLMYAMSGCNGVLIMFVPCVVPRCFIKRKFQIVDFGKECHYLRKGMLPRRSIEPENVMVAVLIGPLMGWGDRYASR